MGYDENFALSQGLAYSVSGGWDTPLDHPGLFAAGGNTAAPAQFLEQLQTVLQVRRCCIIAISTCLIADYTEQRALCMS